MVHVEYAITSCECKKPLGFLEPYQYDITTFLIHTLTSVSHLITTHSTPNIDHLHFEMFGIFYHTNFAQKLKPCLSTQYTILKLNFIIVLNMGVNLVKASMCMSPND